MWLKGKRPPNIAWQRLIRSLLGACLLVLATTTHAYSGKVKQATAYPRAGSSFRSPAPVVIQYGHPPASAPWGRTLSANSQFAVYVNQAQQAFFTGINGYGQFGDGGTNPVNNNQWEAGPLGVQAVAAGETQTLFLTGSGDPLGAGHVRSAGQNDDGQLGTGNYTDASVFTVARTDPGSPLAGGPLAGIVQLVSGREHSLALDASNRIWVVGDNDHGQLAINSCPLPTATCVVNEVTINSWRVAMTGLPAGGTVLSVGAGGDFSLALVSNPATGKNELYAAGYNVLGEFGLGDIMDRYQWTLIAPDVMKPVRGPTYAAGWWHLIYLDSGGVLHGAGDNSCGQLGFGPGDPACNADRPDYNPSSPNTMLTQQYSTVFVSPPSGIKRFSQVAAGPYTSFGILANGDLYASGANANGQLGTGATWWYQLGFVRVLDNVSSVVGGRYFSLALRGGDVYYAGGIGGANGPDPTVSFAGNPASNTWQLAK